MSILPQTKSDLERLITEKVEESLHLEYKDARSISSDSRKKAEIAKDVSAMANSSGGTIIYGMKEFDDEEKKHLPEKITPIDRREFSKEWLEQVINSNISPRIEGLLVHPIQLDQSHEVAYVVEIPQSTTAHQNLADGRYYRRFNFMSVWMADYEIRDIMNRAKHPVIELGFEIEKETYEVKDRFPFPATGSLLGQQQKKKEYRTDVTLRIFAINTGAVFAQYINYFVQLPEDVVGIDEKRYLHELTDGAVEFYGENTFRDVVDVELMPLGGAHRKYGPSRFDPVLPGLRGRPEKLKLVEHPQLDHREVSWIVHADNAPPRIGKVKLNEIPVIKKEPEDNNG
jgi:hypothetical protein